MARRRRKLRLDLESWYWRLILPGIGMVETFKLNSLRTQTLRSSDVPRSARPRQTSRSGYWTILNDPEIGAGPYTGPPCYSPGPVTGIGKAAASMLACRRRCGRVESHRTGRR